MFIKYDVRFKIFEYLYIHLPDYYLNGSEQKSIPLNKAVKTLYEMYYLPDYYYYDNDYGEL